MRYATPDIWITPALLGSHYSHAEPDQELVATIELPAMPTDFIPDDEPGTARIPAFLPKSGNAGPALGLNVIRVTVTLPGTGTAALKQQLLDRGQSREFQAMLEPSWSTAVAVAETQVQRFLAWVRILTRQTWLGLAEEPLTQYGRAHLFDAKANVRLISHGPLQTSTAFLSDQSLSEEAGRVLAEKLKQGASVPTGAALLADAEHMQLGRAAVDSHRAILSAAMACEIALKETLRTVAPTGAADLADLVLNRQSNIDKLCSDVSRAIIGRDLKAEDEPLHKRIVQLSQLRNRVVHRGVSVHPDEAHGLVVAARQLFGWLDDVNAMAQGQASAQTEP